MLVLKVPDMSCGHCASTIEKAVKSVDPNASVEADLSTKIVSIESRSSPAAIEAAVRDAGYEPAVAG